MFASRLKDHKSEGGYNVPEYQGKWGMGNSETEKRYFLNCNLSSYFNLKIQGLSVICQIKVFQ
jgi:hypothetical protein